jgi:ATP-binding cassette subfamily B protein
MYVKHTVDELMNNSDFGKNANLLWLSVQIGLMYILFSIGKGFFLFLMRQTIIVMSRHIEFDLKNEIFQQYERLDLAFFKRNSTGDLMNRISEDVGLVRMYLGPGIMYSINLVVLFTMTSSKMLSISPKLTLFALIPLPIMSFLIYKVSSKMNALSKKVQEEQSFLSTIAQETFAGIRVVKAYNRDNETAEKFENSANEYKARTMKLVLINALFMPTILFLIGMSTLITIYLGGKMLHTKEIADYGTIVAFIFFVNNLTWPFASIGWVTAIIQRASASQTRINEFLKQEPTISNPTKSEFDFQGDIEFENVSFTYPDTGIEAIKNLSFKVKRGDTLAVVGRTGSGKSTLLQLLMRQYDPSSGRILIDGADLKTINLEKFRNQSGVVPQDVFLFSETIADNLQFGVKGEKVSDSELQKVTEMTHVYHNIQEFPDKFQTVLGERGVNLSGGQKQRISIARALLRHPKLLLLDDCLSAVDTETEEIILSNLNKVASGRTSVVVSHRISTIRNANQILVIDHGQIIEQGTHQLLLAKEGVYAEMYRKQLTEE